MRQQHQQQPDGARDGQLTATAPPPTSHPSRSSPIQARGQQQQQQQKFNVVQPQQRLDKPHIARGDHKFYLRKKLSLLIYRFLFPSLLLGASHSRPSGGFVDQSVSSPSASSAPSSSMMQSSLPPPPILQSSSSSSSSSIGSVAGGAKKFFRTVNLEVDQLISKKKSDENYFEIKVL